MNWLCLAFLPVTLVISGQIKVFPSTSHSIAGVSHVSYINDDNKLSYNFNASEAREICSTLGQTLASQAQVQNALAQGLETCRFGWVDEHFAVIPRIKASAACGNNNTGLVKWRATVLKKFDAFCFNKSDMIQLEDTTADSPSSTRDLNNATPPTSDPKPSLPSETVVVAHSAHSTSLSPSTHLTDTTLVSSAPPSPSSTHSASQHRQERAEVPRRALLIVSSCVLLLTLISILGYVKLNNICFLKSDVKHREAAEEWTSMKHVNEPQSQTEEEVTIEVDTTTS